MFHVVCVGEKAGARNLVFFRVKWLQPAMKGTSCVRRVRCDSDLSADFLHFGAGDFPFKIPLKQCFKIVFLFALAPRSRFGGAISHIVACSYIVFCNSLPRCCIVMAESRLLGAAAACVILLSFAAGHHKSYWSGCIKASFVVHSSTGKHFVQPL